MAGKSANRKFADGIIAQSVNINRFGETVRQDVLGILVQLRDELIGKLTKLDLAGTSRESFKRAKVEKLLDQVRATIGEHYAAVSNGVMPTALRDLAEIRSDGIQRIAKDVFAKAPILTTALTPTDLRVIATKVIVEGNPAEEWWNRQAVGTRMAFSREVRLGIASGETTDDIVRRIRGRDTGQRVVVRIKGKPKVLPKFSGGIMDIATRQAEALVRTSVQQVSNDVLHKTYKANEDVLAGEQLLATLDTRTCPICMGYDGGVWDLSTREPTKASKVQAPYPGDLPLHYGCRCVWVPVTKSWAELIKGRGAREVPAGLKEMPESTRASMNGQVAEKVTYDEWLRDQPKDVQVDALGKGKWELWNDGKIKNVNQLVDQSGNVLTVKQLKASIGQEVAVKAPPVVLPPTPPPDVAPLPKGFASEFGNEADLWVDAFKNDTKSYETAEKLGRPYVEYFVQGARARLEELADSFGTTVDEMRSRDLDLAARGLMQKAYGTQAMKDIDFYTGDGYRGVNTLLRKPNVDVFANPPDPKVVAMQPNHRTFDQHVEMTARSVQDTILKQPPLKNDLVVYRGDRLQFDVGTDVTLKGFVSTSLHPSVPINAFGQGNVFYEIKLPAGSRGVLGGINTGEFEVLLPHGAKFKVLSVKEVEVSRFGQLERITVYKLEYVGV